MSLVPAALSRPLGGGERRGSWGESDEFKHTIFRNILLLLIRFLNNLIPTPPSPLSLARTPSQQLTPRVITDCVLVSVRVCLTVPRGAGRATRGRAMGGRLGDEDTSKHTIFRMNTCDYAVCATPLPPQPSSCARAFALFVDRTDRLSKGGSPGCCFPIRRGLASPPAPSPKRSAHSKPAPAPRLVNCLLC